MNKEEYWQYIGEVLADEWELLTYCEEETNPHKDYEAEEYSKQIWNDLNEEPDLPF